MLKTARDWLLRRLLKFLLKKSLGKYLRAELDLEQLDVKLDSGCVELKNVLLNCDALNADLSIPGWHLRACHVECVRAQLRNPSSSWTVPGNCSIDFEEVTVTVSPTGISLNPDNKVGVKHHGPYKASAADDKQEHLPDIMPSSTTSFWGISLDDVGGMGYASVTEGIAAIANSLQALLQGLRASASNVTIRIELSFPEDIPAAQYTAVSQNLPGSSGHRSSSSSSSYSLVGDHPHAPEQQAPVAVMPLILIQIARLEYEDRSDKEASWNSISGSRTSTGPASVLGGIHTTRPAGFHNDHACQQQGNGLMLSDHIIKHIRVEGLELNLTTGQPLDVSGTASSVTTGAGTSSSSFSSSEHGDITFCKNAPAAQDTQKAGSGNISRTSSRFTHLLWGIADMPGVSAGISIGLGWGVDDETPPAIMASPSSHAVSHEAVPTRPLKQHQQQQHLSIVSVDLNVDPFKLILSPDQLPCLTAACEAINRAQLQQRQAASAATSDTVRNNPLSSNRPDETNGTSAETTATMRGLYSHPAAKGGGYRPVASKEQYYREGTHSSIQGYLDLPPQVGSSDYSDMATWHHSIEATYKDEDLCHQAQYITTSHPMQYNPALPFWRELHDAPYGQPDDEYNNGSCWGSKSIMEELLLPDCKRLVLDSMEPCAVRSLSLAESFMSDTSYEDARSNFSPSSSYHHPDHSLIYHYPGHSSSLPTSSNSPQKETHHSAYRHPPRRASYSSNIPTTSPIRDQHVPPASNVQYKLTLSAGQVQVLILYNTGGCGTDCSTTTSTGSSLSSATSPDLQPGLCFEMDDLHATLDTARPPGSSCLLDNVKQDAGSFNTSSMPASRRAVHHDRSLRQLQNANSSNSKLYGGHSLESFIAMSLSCTRLMFVEKVICQRPLSSAVATSAVEVNKNPGLDSSRRSVAGTVASRGAAVAGASRDEASTFLQGRSKEDGREAAAAFASIPNLLWPQASNPALVRPNLAQAMGIPMYPRPQVMTAAVNNHHDVKSLNPSSRFPHHHDSHYSQTQAGQHNRPTSHSRGANTSEEQAGAADSPQAGGCLLEVWPILHIIAAGGETTKSPSLSASRSTTRSQKVLAVSVQYDASAVGGGSRASCTIQTTPITLWISHETVERALKAVSALSSALNSPSTPKHDLGRGTKDLLITKDTKQRLVRQAANTESRLEVALFVPNLCVVALVPGSSSSSSSNIHDKFGDSRRRPASGYAVFNITSTSSSTLIATPSQRSSSSSLPPLIRWTSSSCPSDSKLSSACSARDSSTLEFIGGAVNLSLLHADSSMPAALEVLNFKPQKNAFVPKGLPSTADGSTTRSLNIMTRSGGSDSNWNGVQRPSRDCHGLVDTSSQQKRVVLGQPAYRDAANGRDCTAALGSYPPPPGTFRNHPGLSLQSSAREDTVGQPVASAASNVAEMALVAAGSEAASSIHNDTVTRGALDVVAGCGLWFSIRLNPSMRTNRNLVLEAQDLADGHAQYVASATTAEEIDEEGGSWEVEDILADGGAGRMRQLKDNLCKLSNVFVHVRAPDCQFEASQLQLSLIDSMLEGLKSFSSPSTSVISDHPSSLAPTRSSSSTSSATVVEKDFTQAAARGSEAKPSSADIKFTLNEPTSSTHHQQLAVVLEVRLSGRIASESAVSSSHESSSSNQLEPVATSNGRPPQSSSARAAMKPSYPDVLGFTNDQRRDPHMMAKKAITETGHNQSSSTKQSGVNSVKAPSPPPTTTAATSAMDSSVEFGLGVHDLNLMVVTGLGGVMGTTFVAAHAEGLCLMHQLVMNRQSQASSCGVVTANPAISTRAGSSTSSQAAKQQTTASSQQGLDAVGHNEASCLLYMPASSQPPLLKPCLDVVFIMRQNSQHEDQTTALVPAAHGPAANLKGAGRLTTRPLINAGDESCKNQASVLVRGLTVSTDRGQMNMSWLHDLACALKPLQSDKEAPAAALHRQPAACHDRQPDAASVIVPALNVSVRLENVALRHEPAPYPLHLLPPQAAARATSKGFTSSSASASTLQGTPASTCSSAAETISPVALVLLIEAVKYTNAIALTCSSSGSSQQEAPQKLSLHSLALFLGLADARKGGWSPESARCASSANLQASGYHCVLQEAALYLTLKLPVSGSSSTSSAKGGSGVSGVSAPSGTAASAASAAAECLEIDVTNQHLMGILTSESLALLIQLAAQVTAYLPAAPAAPQSPRAHRRRRSSRRVKMAGMGKAPPLTQVLFSNEVVPNASTYDEQINMVDHETASGPPLAAPSGIHQPSSPIEVPAPSSSDPIQSHPKQPQADGGFTRYSNSPAHSVKAAADADANSVVPSGAGPSLQVQLEQEHNELDFQDGLEASPDSTQDYASANEWEDGEEVEEQEDLHSPLDGWEFSDSLLELVLKHYNQAEATTLHRSEGGLSTTTVSEGLTVDLLVPDDSEVLKVEDGQSGSTTQQDAESRPTTSLETNYSNHLMRLYNGEAAAAAAGKPIMIPASTGAAGAGTGTDAGASTGAVASTCFGAGVGDRPSLSGSEGEDSSDAPLDEEAFSRPAAAGTDMAASVFVNGCWYPAGKSPPQADYSSTPNHCPSPTYHGNNNDSARPNGIIVGVQSSAMSQPSGLTAATGQFPSQLTEAATALLNAASSPPPASTTSNNPNCIIIDNHFFYRSARRTRQTLNNDEEDGDSWESSFSLNGGHEDNATRSLVPGEQAEGGMWDTDYHERHHGSSVGHARIADSAAASVRETSELSKAGTWYHNEGSIMQVAAQDATTSHHASASGVLAPIAESKQPVPARVEFLSASVTAAVPAHVLHNASLQLPFQLDELYMTNRQQQQQQQPACNGTSAGGALLRSQSQLKPEKQAVGIGEAAGWSRRSADGSGSNNRQKECVDSPGLAGSNASHHEDVCQSRIILRGFSGLWVIHTSPELESAAVTSKPRQGFKAGNQEAHPAHHLHQGIGRQGRMEVQIDGLTVAVEGFRSQGHLARRMHVQVHTLEVRDCVSGSGAAAAADHGSSSAGGPRAADDAKILSCRLGRARDSRSHMIDLCLSTVRPDPETEPHLEEMRLDAALLPMKIRLNKALLDFMKAYGQAVFSKQLQVALQAVSALQLHLQGAPVSVPFFQHVHLRQSSVELHYRADRVNVAALRDGQLHELVNLVPWEGVVLDVKAVRLAGLQGWDGIAMSAAQEWLQDITRNQLHKFLVGMAPVKRVCKIMSAVSALLYGPAELQGSSSSTARLVDNHHHGAAVALLPSSSARQFVPPVLAPFQVRVGSHVNHRNGGAGGGGMVGSSGRVLAGARNTVRRTVVAAGRSQLLAQVKRSAASLSRALVVEALQLSSNSGVETCHVAKDTSREDGQAHLLTMKQLPGLAPPCHVQAK